MGSIMLVLADHRPHAAWSPRASQGDRDERRPAWRMEEGGEMSRTANGYSSSDSEGLAGSESLATTRVRALFSASSCSFICLRV